jgi:hypothetical protein
MMPPTTTVYHEPIDKAEPLPRTSGQRKMRRQTQLPPHMKVTGEMMEDTSATNKHAWPQRTAC